MLDEPAAAHGTDRRRNGAESRPGADRAAALGFIERVADDRQAARDEERRTGSLERAAGDEHAWRCGETARNRCDGEHDNAGEEHSFAAELIAQRSADENQGPEKQRV